MHESSDLPYHQGSVEEFTELFAKAQRKLYVFIVAMIGDTADAYDVLQDTNLALWQNFHRFDSGTNFFAWAREIARYRVLRHWQVVGVRPRNFDTDVLYQMASIAADESESQHDHRLDALRHCLDELPANQRQIVEARYSPAGSLRSLSELIGKSENSLSQSLRRIRAALAKCVERRLSILEAT